VEKTRFLSGLDLVGIRMGLKHLVSLLSLIPGFFHNFFLFVRVVIRLAGGNQKCVQGGQHVRGVFAVGPGYRGGSIIAACATEGGCARFFRSSSPANSGAAVTVNGGFWGRSPQPTSKVGARL